MIKKKILLCFLLFVGLFTPVTINADVSSTGKIDIIDDADIVPDAKLLEPKNTDRKHVSAPARYAIIEDTVTPIPNA